MTQNDILKRTAEDGDCLMWTGSLVHGTLPVITVANKKLYAKRQLMILSGRDVAGKCVTNTCGEKMCINPAHLVILTKGGLAKKTALTKRYTTADCAKIAQARRAHSKLSQDAVLEIRASDEPAQALADRYRITPAYVYMLRKGLFRRDYNNPFSGLMT